MLIEMFVVRIVEMIMMLTCSGGDGDGVNLLDDVVDLLGDVVDLLGNGGNLLDDGIDLLDDGVDLLDDGVDFLGDGGDLLGDGVNLLGDYVDILGEIVIIIIRQSSKTTGVSKVNCSGLRRAGERLRHCLTVFVTHRAARRNWVFLELDSSLQPKSPRIIEFIGRYRRVL